MNEINKLLNKDPEEIFNIFKNMDSLSQKYVKGDPYPHVIIENFFSDEILKSIEDDLNSYKKDFKVSFNDNFQKNKSISTGRDVPPYVSLLASKFAAAQMLRGLEKITGLKKLIPDPYYNTEYGYFHTIAPGGILGSHVDHSHHTTLDTPHVLNIVVYITKDWNPDNGGSLCLFDKTGKKIIKKIPSTYNTAVIFACNPSAYHGVEPVSEESPRQRQSLYFAYYTADNKSQGLESTFPLKHQNNSNYESKYGTYFIVPFKELWRPENLNHLFSRVLYICKLLIPPIVFLLIKKVRKIKK